MNTSIKKETAAENETLPRIDLAEGLYESLRKLYELRSVVANAAAWEKAKREGGK